MQTSPSDESTESDDRIERSVLIAAPRSRVWRALTQAEEFGRWFGAQLAGQSFRPGARVRGPITICKYEHVWFDVVVERVEPQTLFSFRWHPYAVEKDVDYSQETPTLVTFRLAAEGERTTRVTVVESGFRHVPPHRRFEAFRMNSAGWEGQLGNVRQHCERTGPADPSGA
ncbi:MAG: SRPBCC family protein [Planctomycetaceae bacterium]|nr:SRPBCC family protein [Planctomycetaceae bacterium]